MTPSQSSNLLLSPMSMTPRIRLPIPRLTLFTGGKECSLCEIAKLDLEKLRKLKSGDDCINTISPSFILTIDESQNIT
ncbi:hypothetical protein I203_104270 [Kwoniella mangroviensis CBS 8507]|uniref:uncharacterized protein n=1 Tax=Kwoniella mangroviensis CBS 8507 TaxID=1296122 RepID=UPI00305E8303